MNPSYFTGYNFRVARVDPWRWIGDMIRLMTLVLAALPALAQALPVDGVGPANMPASLASPPVLLPRALPDWAPVAIALDAVDVLESRGLEDEDSIPGPLRIGFERTIPELQDPADLWTRQAWHWTGDGGLAFAFRMTSPGALALRLGVRVLAMPDGATLRFHAPGVDQVQEITGGEVKASLRANIDAGEVGEEAETFWSPVIEGEAVTLEIELPASADPDELEIALPRLSHLFQLPYGGMALSLYRHLAQRHGYLDPHPLFSDRQSLHFEPDRCLQPANLLVLAFNLLQ